MNLFSVKDRVIVITGATGVLGRAMVSHFAEEGAKVVMLGRNVQRGTQIAEKARAAGGEAGVVAPGGGGGGAGRGPPPPTCSTGQGWRAATMP